MAATPFVSRLAPAACVIGVTARELQVLLASSLWRRRMSQVSQVCAGVAGDYPALAAPLARAAARGGVYYSAREQSPCHVRFARRAEGKCDETWPWGESKGVHENVCPDASRKALVY